MMLSIRKCYHQRPCSCSILVFLLLLLLSAVFAVDGFNHRIPSKQATATPSSHRHQPATPTIHHRAMSTAKKQKLNNDTDDDATSLHPVRAGFIGCGTIASAIATGLATPDHATNLAENGLSLSSISVTRRSESKSKVLKDNFGDVVTVYESAEEVVSNSDVVFLCVLPQQVDEVLEDLSEKGVWRMEEHTLVSLVATSKVEDLIQKSGLPRASVYKMICLPPIAKRQGCALLQPAPAPAPSSEENGNEHDNKKRNVIKSMLHALGGFVECANDDIMNAMMIPGCMMGPMYGVMRNNRDWLVKQGVSSEDASYFVGRTYLSIVQDAELDCRNPKRFDDLIEEQTPGGINEQSLSNLEKQNTFESYDRTMDAVLSRLQGKSDGSLPSDK